MNIYVETNFVLELVFAQEQATSCEQIIQLCESGSTTLVIPTYSLAEPHEKMTRQARKRRELSSELDTELQQLLRTSGYDQRIGDLQDIADLLIESTREEQQRWRQYLERVLNVAHVILLTANLLAEAANCETTYRLTPQDALVFASVMSHLRQARSQPACFLNRNSKDFRDPDILNELARFNCQMIPNFAQGYQFILSRLEG